MMMGGAGGVGDEGHHQYTAAIDSSADVSHVSSAATPLPARAPAPRSDGDARRRTADDEEGEGEANSSGNRSGSAARAENVIAIVGNSLSAQGDVTQPHPHPHVAGSSGCYVPASALADRVSLLRHISLLAEQLSALQLRQLGTGGESVTITGTGSGGDEDDGGNGDPSAACIVLQQEKDRLTQQLAESGLLQEALRQKVSELEQFARDQTSQNEHLREEVTKQRGQLMAERDFSSFLALSLDPAAQPTDLEAAREDMEAHHAKAAALPREDPHHMACGVQRLVAQRLDTIFQGHQNALDEANERERALFEQLTEVQRHGPTVRVVSPRLEPDEGEGEHVWAAGVRATDLSSSGGTGKCSHALVVVLEAQRRALMEEADMSRQQFVVQCLEEYNHTMMIFVAQWYRIQWDQSTSTSTGSARQRQQPAHRHDGQGTAENSHSMVSGRGPSHTVGSGSRSLTQDMEEASHHTSSSTGGRSHTSAHRHDEGGEGDGDEMANDARAVRVIEDLARANGELKAELSLTVHRFSAVEAELSVARRQLGDTQAQLREAQDTAVREGRRVDNIKAWERRTLDELHEEMVSLKQRVMEEARGEIARAYDVGRLDGSREYEQQHLSASSSRHQSSRLSSTTDNSASASPSPPKTGTRIHVADGDEGGGGDATLESVSTVPPATASLANSDDESGEGGGE